METARTTIPISRADLKRLARLAAEDQEDFFSRHPEFALLYRKRLLCTALCEDAALHYTNGTTGFIEFNVWSFYAEHAEAPFPFQNVAHADFGASRFGRAPDAPPTYSGRRVELNGRSIEASPVDDPAQAVQRYLKAASTPSARELGRKAVVLLAPAAYLGAEIWPTLALPSA